MTSTSGSAPAAATFRRLGRGTGPVDYHQAWDLQRQLHAARVAEEVADTVLLLEHAGVYTAGRRTQPAERPVDPAVTVVDVDRGGKITWHGPGQLVIYPIVKLPPQVYVVDYVRRLEEALIRACATLGVSSGRVPGRTGVWLAGDGLRPERKIAAIGVRVAQRVTMHGAALNCTCALDAFAAIIPCGISDAGVTSLSAELGRGVTTSEAAAALEPALRDLFAWGPYGRSPDIGPADADPPETPGRPAVATA